MFKRPNFTRSLISEQDFLPLLLIANVRLIMIGQCEHAGGSCVDIVDLVGL